MKDLNKTSSDVNSAMKNVQKATGDTANSMNDLTDIAKDTNNSLKDTNGAADQAAKGIKAMGVMEAGQKMMEFGGKIIDVVKNLMELTEATKEFNSLQSKLQGSTKQNGYKQKDANKNAGQVYGYTGDDMMAVNVVSNLQKMGLSQSELDKTINASLAVWSAYGDSIPIEGLTESITETAQVSKVTGNLADALNWAGVSEDSFNNRLEATKTVQERAKLINDTLIGSYGKSKQIYDENTKAIRAYNESQDAVAQKQAELGKTLAPVNTMINNAKVALMNGLMPVIQEITPKVLEFGEKVKSAFEKFRKSEEANNLLQVFRGVFETVWNAAKAVIEAVSPTIKNIFNWIGDHANQIKGIIQKLGNIWKNVWGAVGPILQAAWKILEPILSSFVDALDAVLWVAEKLSGALKGVSQAFKNIAQAFGRKDVQKALNASNSVKTDPTYGAYTQIKDRAMGQRVIPRDNTLINAHQGEMLLTAREVRQYKKGNTPQISITMNGTIIREEADLDRFAEKLVRKLNQQKIVTG